MNWLIIYPILFLIFLFAGAKLAPRKSFHADYQSLETGKTIQAFAALNIILHHLTQSITQFGRWNKGPISIYDGIGFFFTGIFFFYSGYGLIVSYDSKPNYLDHFLRKRLSAVAIPFVVTNIMFFLVEGIWWQRVNLAEGVGAIWDILLYASGIKLFNGNAWFIVVIILLYICFYITHRLIKNKTLALWAMAACALALTILGMFRLHNPDDAYNRWFRGEWWYNTTMVFVFGMVWGRNKEKMTHFFQKKYPIHLAIVAVACLGTYYLQQVAQWIFGYYQEWPGHPGYGQKAITLVAQLLAVLMFVLFIQLLAMKIHCKNKIMTFLGSISLELYLIHEIYRDYFYEIHRLDYMLYYGTAFALSIITAFLLHWLDQVLVKAVVASKQ